MIKIGKANTNEGWRLVMAGEGGVGKTSQAVQFVRSLVFPIESGTARIKNREGQAVDIVEGLTSWPIVMKALEEVRDNDFGFKTLVIDSITALEKMCHAEITKNTNKTMKTVEGGYGAGSAKEESLMINFRDLLEQIRLRRGMDIILIAHTTVKAARDPSIAEDYDEFEMDMDKKAAAVLRQWCDALLYIRPNTFVTQNDESKKGRVISDDTMIAYTRVDPIFRAKNRFGMPRIIPFGYDFADRFYEFVAGGVKDEAESEDFATDDLANIKADIIRAAAELKDEETKNKVLRYIEDPEVGKDLNRLKTTLERVHALQGEGK